MPLESRRRTRSSSARRGDGVELRRLRGQRAEADDVGLHLRGGDDALQRGRRRHRVALAALGAVGQQDDRVFTARHRAVALDDRLQVVRRRVERGRERRRPGGAELAVAAAAVVAVIAGQHARVEVGLDAVEPLQRLLERLVEAHEHVGPAPRRPARSRVVDAVALVGPADVDVGVERRRVAGRVEPLHVAAGRDGEDRRHVVARIVVATAELLAFRTSSRPGSSGWGTRPGGSEPARSPRRGTRRARC